MVQYGRLEEQPPAWVMILVKVKILWEETKRNRKFKGQDIWNITLSTPRWTTSSSPSTLRPTLSSTPTRWATLSTSLSTLNLCLFFPPVPVCKYKWSSVSQDFKFRTVIVSAFQRKRNFTSFRTSVRSSFGSSRYHTRYMQIRIIRNHNRYSHMHNVYLDTTQGIHKLR